MIKNSNPPQQPQHRHVNNMSSGAKKSMLTRAISAVVMIVLIVPTIFLGDWIYFGVFSLFMAIACYEILGCAGKRKTLIYIVYLLFVASIAYWPLFKGIVFDLTQADQVTSAMNGSIDHYFRSICLPISIVIIGFFLLFLLTVIYKDFSVVDASFLMTMAIIIGLGFQGLFYLRYIPINLFNYSQAAWNFNVENTVRSSLLLLFVILSTIMTDTGAYFVGVFFGKNKMNERISPKKTWEGFVGGIVISSVVSISVALAFAASKYPVVPFFTLENWYYIVPLCLIIPIIATLGDFVFSSIKRYWGIKDYGKLIPGHGGVLDRLDSIFFAVMISSIYIYIVSNIVTTGTINWEALLI